MSRSLLVVALLALLVAAPPATAAKKKSKGGGTINITNAVNTPIPDRGAAIGSPPGTASSSIQVGKAFKGKRIRDLNVGFQTTGSAAGAAADLLVELIAPGGTSSNLFITGTPTQSLGPLTLDDESNVLLVGSSPPCVVPPPWTCTPVGTMRGQFPFARSLARFNGGPAMGTWTLRLYDTQTMRTSVLNSWTLQATTGKPYKTK